MKKAYLILEDGTVFEGKSVGSEKEIIGEIVFNTGVVGYLETLTDPSYAGQAVCMTFPLQGDYGVCKADMESDKAYASGFIAREICAAPSNFRSEMSLEEFLKEQGVTGICGIDTRALTRLLRDRGTMNGMITTKRYKTDEALKRIRAYKVRGVVASTTCKEKYSVGDPNAKYKVALMDYGEKRNIARCLAERDCLVTVYPATTGAEEVLADDPDGVMLSNGPGDPAECAEIIAEVKKLYDSDKPIFAICLGHQLMALATGAKTKKLKYGHRGGNQPVKYLAENRVYITSQNHGYYVDERTLDKSVAVPSFVNVNDGTNEGLEYIGKKIFTVQFHPEACPGPLDTRFLFDKFIKMLQEEE